MNLLQRVKNFMHNNVVSLNIIDTNMAQLSIYMLTFIFV